MARFSLEDISLFEGGGEVKKKQPTEEKIQQLYNNHAIRQAYLESGFDSLAYNKGSGATGIYQITQGVIDDYNKANKTNIKLADMIHPAKARPVRDWEMNRLYDASWQQNPNMTDEVRQARSYFGYNAGRNNARKTLNSLHEKGINIHTNLDFVNHINQESKDYVNFMMTGKGNAAHRNYEQFRKAVLKNPDVIKQIDYANGGYISTPVRRTLANGGGIYIKPSHRGRLTELKARTGKTESELYNDGNPAHKKMVVFARNARKWKH